jgi:hypothetical protein
MATKEIITAHEAKGRLYPRPRGKCEECKEEIVLCWGEKTKPYWRHLKKSTSCNNKSLGESVTHKLAKEYLVNFLNKGGTIQFQNKCNKCKREFETNLIGGRLKFQAEIAHTSSDDKICVFDVAGLNSKDQIIFGIEVYYKHKTDNSSEARKYIEWFEVTAEDVLDTLDDDKVGKSIILNNCRVINQCENYYCITIRDMARCLGYVDLYSPYSHEVYKFIDIAKKGKYAKDIFIWNTKGWDKNSQLYEKTQELRKQTASTKVCLSCEKKNAEISIWKPFCKLCWQIIKREEEKGEYIASNWQEATDMRQDASNALFWLRDVPANWNVGTPCFYCKRTYCDTKENEDFKEFWETDCNYVKGYIFWYGKRCCCSVCLIDQFEKAKIKIEEQKHKLYMESRNNEKHKLAKEKLMKWFRESTDEDGYITCGQFRSRSNRGGIHCGVYEEWPIAEEKEQKYLGTFPVWDETAYRITGKLPVYEELQKLGFCSSVKVILDVITIHKGFLHLAFEITHNYPISKTRINEIAIGVNNPNHGYTGIYTISADWILAQETVPEELETIKIFRRN